MAGDEPASEFALSRWESGTIRWFEKLFTQLNLDIHDGRRNERSLRLSRVLRERKVRESGRGREYRWTIHDIREDGRYVHVL